MITSASYDSSSDSFTGFCPPLINGIPSIGRFKTDSYSELEKWFTDLRKSTLINAHVVEPIMGKPSTVYSRPYILSAYGTANEAKAIDILQRWIYIYDECKRQNIHLVGFSTDADPRYLKAMKLALGFFVRTPNINLASGETDSFEVCLPQSWTFFFMRPKQKFFCMQDGIHIATKIRNRILSSTANMSMGDRKIDVGQLLRLIENHSKLDHNLVKSDVLPYDRQNFVSCLKITSDDVLVLLDRPETRGTYVYLYLLKLIILTYVRADTNPNDRLYFGWTLAFVYRMWW